MNPTSIASIGGGVGSASSVLATTSFAPALILSPLLAKCASTAQRKQRRNTRHNTAGAEQRGRAADKLSEVFGTSRNSPGNELLLNGLPVLQARYYHPHQRGALFCRSGNWLEIVPYEYYYHRRGTEQWEHEEWHRKGRGYIRGTSKSSSPFLCSVNSVMFQPPSNYTAECVFMEEMLENYYNLYSSCLFGTRKRAWYVALRRTGRTKVGPHTRRKQKSSHFLVVHFDKVDSSEDDHGDDDVSTNSQATVLRQHADSKVHPDELPTVVDRWKTYYATVGNTSEHENQRMTIQRWNPPAGNNRSGARQLASMPMMQSSTPVNHHEIRRHRFDGRQPATSTTRAWLLPSTQIAHRLTPFIVGRSDTVDGGDTRLRRLEREEVEMESTAFDYKRQHINPVYFQRRRALRRLELENLRRSTPRN